MNEHEIGKVLDELQEACYNNSVDHGFWLLPSQLENQFAASKDEKAIAHMVISQRLMLITSELAECCEAIRQDKLESEHLPGFTGLEEELADVVIRVFDLAARFAPNLPDAIITKMKYNKTRPMMHGKIT